MRAPSLLALLTLSIAHAGLADDVTPVTPVTPVTTHTAHDDTPLAVGDLPDHLPPMDDVPPMALAPTWRLAAQGRVRLELDVARDFVTTSPTLGLALGGRIGVQGLLGAHSVTVVLGDGGRVGQPAVAAALVEPALVPLVQQAFVTLAVPFLDDTAHLSLGRMPMVVADGRMVGSEPWDPRGRTLDGARLDVTREALRVRAGAFVLAGSDTGLRALGTLDVRAGQGDDVIDVYGLWLREGGLHLSAPTLGTRLRASVLGVVLHAGLDVQASVVDSDGVRPRGYAAHGEAGVHVAPPVSWPAHPFVDVGVEATGGDVVAGRTFRLPAPTRHDFLGALDRVDLDNTAMGLVRIGTTSDDGASLDATGRLLGALNARDGVRGDDGKPLLAPTADHSSRIDTRVLAELDVHASWRVAAGLTLDAAYGLAFPLGGVACVRRSANSVCIPTERGWLEVRFDLDDPAAPLCTP